MTSLHDATAAELAAALRGLRSAPHMTGALSMLDEVTDGYDRIGPELAQAHREFVAARFAHQRSYRPGWGSYDDAKWDEAMAAADRLADLLEPLGDYTIPRCKRPSRWSPVCNYVLRPDGTCFSSGHLDQEN